VSTFPQVRGYFCSSGQEIGSLGWVTAQPVARFWVMALFTSPQQPLTQPKPTADDIAAVVTASQSLACEPFDIPGLIAGSLYPHQYSAIKAGIDVISRRRGLVLGDDMGMGKTRVLLALLAIHSKTRALIVTPVANYSGYVRELAATFPGLRMFKAFGHKPTAVPADANIVWMGDDPRTLQAWLCDTAKVNGKKVYTANALTQTIDFVVRDESHRDKGNAGEPNLRGHVMLTVAEDVRSRGGAVVVATGTLTSNRPIEALMQIRIAGGDDLVKAVAAKDGVAARTLSAFKWRYCNPVNNGYGYSFDGFANLLDLHHNLRSTCYVRREKREMDPGMLPGFGWLVQPLAVANDAMRTYDRIKRNFLDWVREQKGVDAAWRAERAQVILELMRLREYAGLAKVDAAVELAQPLLDEGKSIVVFYEHRSVYTALAAAFLNAGARVCEINGSSTAASRRDAEEGFQTGRYNVILAQLAAASQAVTLTAASDTLFVQLPWSAGAIAQAAGRTLRCDDLSKARADRGETVNYHVLQTAYADGEPSFDMDLWDVLQTKAQITDAINIGNPDVTVPSESVMEAVLRRFVS